MVIKETKQQSATCDNRSFIKTFRFLEMEERRHWRAILIQELQQIMEVHNMGIMDSATIRPMKPVENAHPDRVEAVA